MKKRRKKEKKLPVLLLEDIVNLGQKGKIVYIKPGYFRYLSSQGKVVLADRTKLATELKPLLLTEKVKSRELLTQKLKEEIEKINIEFKVNQYTSLSREKIAKILKDKGFNISKDRVELKEKIKQAGDYIVPIKLGYNLIAQLKVSVRN